jgi:hypothetical protein
MKRLPEQPEASNEPTLIFTLPELLCTILLSFNRNGHDLNVETIRLREVSRLFYAAVTEITHYCGNYYMIPNDMLRTLTGLRKLRVDKHWRVSEEALIALTRLNTLMISYDTKFIVDAKYSAAKFIINSLTSLKSLSLMGRHEDLEYSDDPLRAMTNLTDLHLWETSVIPYDALGMLTGLRSLDLAYMFQTRRNGRTGIYYYHDENSDGSLKHLTALQTLSLRNMKIDVLPKLPCSITSLYLEGTPATTRQSLSTLTSLRNLAIRERTKIGLEDVVRLTTLVELDIGNDNCVVFIDCHDVTKRQMIAGKDKYEQCANVIFGEMPFLSSVTIYGRSYLYPNPNKL